MQCIVGRVLASCVVIGVAKRINILHVCNVYVCMHNKENLRFIQIHAAAVRVEHPALSPFPALY